MKKLMISAMAIPIMLIMIIPIVMGASVSVARNMPDRVDPNGVLTVSFSISPEETMTGFDLADLIPLDWTISDWSVSGFDKADVDIESQTQSYLDKSYTAYHWKFNKNLTSSATLTYTISVPVSSGSYEFVGIWTYPGGFSSDKKTLNVGVAPQACPTCPSASDWSACVEGKQTRTNYRCSADTNYICESYTEEQTCEIPVEKPSYTTIYYIIGAVILVGLVYILYKKFYGKKLVSYFFKPKS